MPSRDIKDLEAVLQNAWTLGRLEYERLYPNASQPFLTCTHRSEAEQAELYAQGRTKAGPIVTKLKKGSKHNFYPSKAFDVAFKKADGSLDWTIKNFENLALIIKAHYPQVEWGGYWSKFKDYPHFQI